MRLKLRKEERLEISEAKKNLWRKIGEGRGLEEEEWKNWEDIRESIKELEEEDGDWILEGESILYSGELVKRSSLSKTTKRLEEGVKKKVQKIEESLPDRKEVTMKKCKEEEDEKGGGGGRMKTSRKRDRDKEEEEGVVINKLKSEQEEFKDINCKSKDKDTDKFIEKSNNNIDKCSIKSLIELFDVKAEPVKTFTASRLQCNTKASSGPVMPSPLKRRKLTDSRDHQNTPEGQSSSPRRQARRVQGRLRRIDSQPSSPASQLTRSTASVGRRNTRPSLQASSPAGSSPHVLCSLPETRWQARRTACELWGDRWPARPPGDTWRSNCQVTNPNLMEASTLDPPPVTEKAPELDHPLLENTSGQEGYSNLSTPAKAPPSAAGGSRSSPPSSPDPVITPGQSITKEITPQSPESQSLSCGSKAELGNIELPESPPSPGSSASCSPSTPALHLKKEIEMKNKTREEKLQQEEEVQDPKKTSNSSLESDSWRKAYLESVRTEADAAGSLHLPGERQFPGGSRGSSIGDPGGTFCSIVNCKNSLSKLYSVHSCRDKFVDFGGKTTSAVGSYCGDQSRGEMKITDPEYSMTSPSTIPRGSRTFHQQNTGKEDNLPR